MLLCTALAALPPLLSKAPGPEHRLLCHAQVPGLIKDGDPLRCELAGNYLAVL